MFDLPNVLKSYDELARLEKGERCFDFSHTKRAKILGKKTSWKNLQTLDQSAMMALFSLFTDLSHKDKKTITLG